MREQVHRVMHEPGWPCKVSGSSHNRMPSGGRQGVLQTDCLRITKQSLLPCDVRVTANLVTPSAPSGSLPLVVSAFAAC
eukprot:4045521-Amphidinium_carterae.1